MLYLHDPWFFDASHFGLAGDEFESHLAGLLDDPAFLRDVVVVYFVGLFTLLHFGYHNVRGFDLVRVLFDRDPSRYLHMFSGDSLDQLVLRLGVDQLELLVVVKLAIGVELVLALRHLALHLHLVVVLMVIDENSLGLFLPELSVVDVSDLDDRLDSE